LGALTASSLLALDHQNSTDAWFTSREASHSDMDGLGRRKKEYWRDDPHKEQTATEGDVHGKRVRLIAALSCGLK